MKARCLLCNAEADGTTEQDAHLAAVHPAPAGGHRFFVDGKPFFTNHPTMRVAEVKALSGVPCNYSFHEERGREQFDLSDANAVDLTRAPHFFAVPPACM